MKGRDTPWPVPLRQESGAMGAALREYRGKPVSATAESVAYGRLASELARPKRRRWLVAATLPLAAAALLGALWARRPPPAPQESLARAVAAPPSPASAPTVPLGRLPTPLPAGKRMLADGITAWVATGTSATGRLAEGIVEIALATGSLELQVPPRKRGDAVLLTAGELRFTVVGTAFSLRHEGQRLSLDVREGLIAVSKGGDHVATVASGERWTTKLPAAEPPHAAPAPRIARRAAPRGCAAIPVSRWQDRLACYKEEAKRPGPVGEHAQHALARYLRDDAVDLTAALDAFEAQRARFPRGPLRADADRAVIELLPRLGRHAEALVESQSFLDAHPDAEDRAELRLMRGDIYRAIFGDLASAEQEYDEGAAGDGRIGDDSRFLRALCLEALGRVDEARLAYRDYLSQEGSAHTREAQRRMERLAK